jgi:hypothetical protein
MNLTVLVKSVPDTNVCLRSPALYAFPFAWLGFVPVFLAIQDEVLRIAFCADAFRHTIVVARFKSKCD